MAIYHNKALPVTLRPTLVTTKQEKTEKKRYLQDPLLSHRWVCNTLPGLASARQGFADVEGHGIVTLQPVIEYYHCYQQCRATRPQDSGSSGLLSLNFS